MRLVAGVDIGNSTTEACIGANKGGKIEFLSSSITCTTGIKGTVQNVKGIIQALNEALDKAGKKIEDLSEIRINEAAPVIGSTAMETITETIITDSTMIGHNPATPGGAGLGTGYTVWIEDIPKYPADKSCIVLVPGTVNYDEAAAKINAGLDRGVDITAVIAEKDEGVLISNRVSRKLPVIDEVRQIRKVPLNAPCAVEVAEGGHTVKTLSNPYGIAAIFNLTPEETYRIIPVAKGLIGTRSAVVIKTPAGQVQEKIVPAGTLYIKGKDTAEKVAVDCGAEEIMRVLQSIGSVQDIEGEQGTNIGIMISRMKNSMAELTSEEAKDIRIKDLLALDTYVECEVAGGLAGETFIEKAVAAAVMVKTSRLPMERIAEKLERDTGVKVAIAGTEAVMAVLGALTTPGVTYPVAVLDLGGGSTDGALLDNKGIVKSIHLAGAGELVTMLIDTELGLKDRSLAEEIKKYPVAKVESLFHIRMENGEFKFFKEPLEPKFFGRIVLMKENMLPVYRDISLEKIVEVRRSAKQRVFVENAVRALMKIAPMNNLKAISNVVLVGGSALDFEIPEMILTEFSKYRIVSGRGNIRSTEGPRNAVATGLVMSDIL
jgi:diol dehydratase reactivase alpha subunit